MLKFKTKKIYFEEYNLSEENSNTDLFLMPENSFFESALPSFVISTILLETLFQKENSESAKANPHARLSAALAAKTFDLIILRTPFIYVSII